MAMDEDVLLADYKAARDTLYSSTEYKSATAERKGELVFRVMFKVIIEHIQTYAQITFRTSDDGIQKSTAPGDATDPPDSNVLLDAGQIS